MNARVNESNGWRWLPLSLGVILLDQYTKKLIVDHIPLGDGIRVLPVLDILHAQNTGAAFSMLATAGGWQRWFFAALAIGVAVAIIVWLGKLKARSQGLLACSLALILAGALGNVIDRLRLGYVTDFIHAHWQSHSFPAFNVADSAITIGACLLLLDVLLETRRTKAQPAFGSGAGASASGGKPSAKADSEGAAP
jgi:signal peptidase II